MNITFTPSREDSKPGSLQMCDHCGWPLEKLTYLKVFFLFINKENLVYCKTRLQFGNTNMFSVLLNPFDMRTWILNAAFILLITGLTKKNRISKALDVVWNFF
jgi:hypothetical protein